MCLYDRTLCLVSRAHVLLRIVRHLRSRNLTLLSYASIRLPPARQERDLAHKLDTLFAKGLFGVALNVAEADQVPHYSGVVARHASTAHDYT